MFDFRIAFSQLLLFICLSPAYASTPLSFWRGDGGEATLMRDVFAAMPDSVLPMVTKNNRLDCIDFIENNMEAKVRNRMDEYVTLEALTKDYARFRTSAASLMEMKLLPTSDSTAVLCVVTTAQTGEEGTPLRLEDSQIRFCNPDWSPLPTDTISSFVENVYRKIEKRIDVLPETSIRDFQQALQALADFHPMRLALSADDASLSVTLQTAQLSKVEREAVRDYLRPLTLMWNGQQFIPAQ